MQLICRVVQPKSEIFRILDKTNLIINENQHKLYNWALDNKRKFISILNKIAVYEVKFGETGITLESLEITDGTDLENIKSILEQLKEVILKKVSVNYQDGKLQYSAEDKGMLNKEAQEIYLSIKLYDCLIAFLFKQSE